MTLDLNNEIKDFVDSQLHQKLQKANIYYENLNKNKTEVIEHEFDLKKLKEDDRQKYAKSLWSFPSLPKYIVSPFASKMLEKQELPPAPHHQYTRF